MPMTPPQTRLHNEVCLPANLTACLCGAYARVGEAWAREQREFRTKDHPMANGRLPVRGDTEWAFTFPLEDGTVLAVRVGLSAGAGEK